MPEYTEENIIGHRDIQPDGQIQIREDTIIRKDGEFLSTTFLRYVISPGDDYSNLEDSVKRICQIEHTPEVIAAFKAAEAARK